jgi:hypothetical protein
MKNKLSALALLIVLVAMFTWKGGRLHDDKGKLYNPIAWDVFGYYLYLPATFIYDDVALENRAWLDSVYAKYKPSPYPYQHTGTETNKRVIVYPMGLSRVMRPDFFGAQL